MPRDAEYRIGLVCGWPLVAVKNSSCAYHLCSQVPALQWLTHPEAGSPDGLVKDTRTGKDRWEVTWWLVGISHWDEGSRHDHALPTKLTIVHTNKTAT
jgi:hypothetical protein